MEYIPVKSDIGKTVQVTIIKTGGKVLEQVTGTLLALRHNRYFVETKNGKHWYKYVTIERED